MNLLGPVFCQHDVIILIYTYFIYFFLSLQERTSIHRCSDRLQKTEINRHVFAISVYNLVFINIK
jgi:hypothetical protein